MQRETVYEVADGYCISERQESIEIGKALELLKGKHRYRYTKAVRCEDKVVFTQHTLRCPNCGQELPSYRRFVEPIVYWRRGERTEIDENAIYELAGAQMMLFEENRRTRMQLNRKVEPLLFTCKKCGHQSEKAQELQEVSITGKKQKVVVASDLNNLSHILEIPFTKEDVSIGFPVTERLVFDLGEKGVFLELWDSHNEKIARQDITSEMEKWQHRQTMQFLNSHTFLMDKLVEAFCEQWPHQVFPYEREECSIKHLWLMTQFPGIPSKEFYVGIPFSKDTSSVDESFADIIRRIDDEESIRIIFEESTLPKIKSVKRYFYQHPSLCFYIRELEILWNVLQDSNLLLQLLEFDIFRVLALLREYPKIEQFLNDYVKLRGAAMLVRLFKQNAYDVLYYGIGYAAMSPECRKKEQEKWSDECLKWRLCVRYSRLFQPLKNVKDCKINGYSFRLLRSSKEYQDAGKALMNCLDFDWNSSSNRGVVVVMKNREYKAAIEVRDDTVQQAFLKKNRPLTQNPGLTRAYIKWARKFQLKEYYDDEFEPDDELPLPFD